MNIREMRKGRVKDKKMVKKSNRFKEKGELDL